MKSFTGYLTESRSKDISIDETKEILKTKCKNTVQYIMDTKNFIYRGVSDVPKLDPFSEDDGYYNRLVTPSKFERSSANTENYYTWIMDNDPAWTDKGFPKRSKSLICINDLDVASNYGDVYAVITFDEARIATVGKLDLWTEFSLNGYGPSEVNVAVRFILKDILKLKTTGYWGFVHNCSKIDDFVKKNGISRIVDFADGTGRDMDAYNSLVKMVLKAMNYDPHKKSFYETLVDTIYSPTPNMFVCKYEDPKIWSHNQELWTDSDAILIPGFHNHTDTDSVYTVFNRLERLMES
jgi:hypothetical protein